eukprot:493098-Amorphochlora_amoeboformis.AAC.1
MKVAYALLATLATANTCPGSKSFIHASCSLTATFSSSSCEEVAGEIIDRINGVNGWKDPHNGGTYTLLSGSTTSNVLDTQRVTGDGKYTDLHRFTLSSEGAGCKVEACSESQVFSILDFSTNYCNLHDLYCGSQDGCPIAKEDLTYSESLGSCRSHDKSTCVVKKIKVSEETVADGKCKQVTTVKDFKLESFISKPWFIQQQMSISYLPESENYCVSARYAKQKKTLFGWDIAVTNVAFESDKSSKHQGNLCATEDSTSDPAKLEVAPCFLPKFASGPYWVLEYNEEEGYALISGGQPSLPTKEGLCKNGNGVNNSGLWIFTRQQARDDALVNKVRGLAKAQGFDLDVLNDVDQTGCPALDL